MLRKKKRRRLSNMQCLFWNKTCYAVSNFPNSNSFEKCYLLEWTCTRTSTPNHGLEIHINSIKRITL